MPSKVPKLCSSHALRKVQKENFFSFINTFVIIKWENIQDKNENEKRIVSFISNELGGWSLLKSTSINRDQRNTYKILVELFKVGVNPLFNIFVSTSPFDPNKPMLQVSSDDDNEF
jgi:hypothetical protein